MKKFKYSCDYLHHSIYLAPNELRNCCKRFFHKGKMKGDVKILNVDKFEDIDLEKINLKELPELEQFMLHKIYCLNLEFEKYFKNYDFHNLYKELLSIVEGKSLYLEEYTRGLIGEEEQHQLELRKMLKDFS